jgi:DNA-binding MarR family transcriptional regulator
MSKRLNDLGELNSRDRSKRGYGLLEAAPNPMDRRYTVVTLSAKGRMLAERMAGMMGL